MLNVVDSGAPGTLAGRSRRR